jgi:hypothetical protein
MRVVLKIKSARAARCLEAVARVSVPSMPRRIGITFAGMALAVASTADMAPPIAVLAPPDPRVTRLERFFRHYNCPTPYHVSDYLRASDGYNLDYRLLPAISVRESQCGLWEQMENNHWGYHPDRQSFSSVEAGIDYVARQLARNPYYRGKSLPEKLFVYNPRRAYPTEVQRIMSQIE